jgi:hypothetical protein
LELLSVDAERIVLQRPPVAAVVGRVRRESDWGFRLGRLTAPWAGAASAFRRPLPLAVGAAACALLLLGTAATRPSVQAFAQGVLQQFRVQRVQPVRLDLAALQGMDTRGYAESAFKAAKVTNVTEPKVEQSSAQRATAATGLTLKGPSRLPASIKGAPTIWLAEPSSFQVTYDGQKLVELAEQLNVRDAALLQQLRAANGMTATASIPAMAAVIYGELPKSSGSGAASALPAGGQSRGIVAQAAPTLGPLLGIVQLKSPTVEVTGNVDLDRLRQLVLRSGVLPPALANELLAIADWKTTVPIPVTRGTTREVAVDGVRATLIIGELPVPVLVWQKDGAVYAMAGTVSESELVAAAQSLAPLR